MNSDHAPTLDEQSDATAADTERGYALLNSLTSNQRLNDTDRQKLFEYLTRYSAALRENREKDAQLKYARAGNLCPVCTGNPLPNDCPCVCGGSGDAQDAYLGLAMDYHKLAAEKDARIAELNAELDKGDSWAWIRGKFEKCRTQFAWYKPRTDSLIGTRYEVMGWLHVLFAHADPKVYIDITMEQQKKADDANARAEAAEAKLRAVSDALEEKPRKVPAGQFHKAELVSSPNDVEAIHARIRAIVEGRDSVPSSPQPPR